MTRVTQLSARQIEKENRRLRFQFKKDGLDPDKVCVIGGDDVAVANRWLRDLQRWVRAYRRYGDRRLMEKVGYRFPPVEPAIDPDTDWLRFERWIKGEPLAWNYVAECGELAAEDELSDAEVGAALERVRINLAERGVRVQLERDIPPRIAYHYLREELSSTAFEYLAPGCQCVLTGCGGFCPECFQRLWCALGQGQGVPGGAARK